MTLTFSITLVDITNKLSGQCSTKFDNVYSLNNFSLIFQACQLIMANRTNLDEFYQHCISLISLNSIQLEWLLAHLSDPPPVPDEWIDLIVTGAKEVSQLEV